jgi:undecaprenyl-diphosphatase
MPRDSLVVLIDALKIPARRTEYSPTESAVSPFHAEPAQYDMPNAKKLRVSFFLAGALLFNAAAVFAFGRIAEEILEGDTQHFDSYLRAAIHGLATPGLTSLMQGFSFVGSVSMVVVLVLLSICWFVYFRRIRAAGLLAITMLGAAVLEISLKLAFHRPRPVAFVGPTPSSYSFPSGHAVDALCFYGVLAAILSTRMRERLAKVLIWAAAVFLTAMIGFSRIYLGVHYPSDVVGGYFAAAIWVSTVAFIDKMFTDGEWAKGCSRPNLSAEGG